MKIRIDVSASQYRALKELIATIDDHVCELIASADDVGEFDDPARNLWERVLERVEEKLNRHSFYTWFRPTFLRREAGNLLEITVPNAMFRKWLEGHYMSVIGEALEELGRPEIVVSFVVAETPAASEAPAASQS